MIPGLVNAHGHVGNTVGMEQGHYSAANVARDLKTYAAYGVTTVFSLGDDQAAGIAARDAQRTPSLDRARLFVAGPVLAPKSPADAVKLVDEDAAMKVDIVKIRVDDNLGTTPKMAPEIYKAVIDEAHKKGLRVAVHLFYLDDAKAVLDAGADFIAHSVRDVAGGRCVHRDAEAAERLLLPDADARGVDLRLRVDAVVVRGSVLPQARRHGGGRGAEAAGAPAGDGDQQVGAALQGRPRSGEPESQEAVGCRRDDRDGHRHRPAGAVPGLLRADGAGDDGEGRADAAAGAGVGDARRRASA